MSNEPCNKGKICFKKIFEGNVKVSGQASYLKMSIQNVKRTFYDFYSSVQSDDI